jgi:hypothetical protein
MYPQFHPWDFSPESLSQVLHDLGIVYVGYINNAYAGA